MTTATHHRTGWSMWPDPDRPPAPREWTRDGRAAGERAVSVEALRLRESGAPSRERPAVARTDRALDLLRTEPRRPAPGAPLLVGGAALAVASVVGGVLLGLTGGAAVPAPSADGAADPGPRLVGPDALRIAVASAGPGPVFSASQLRDPGTTGGGTVVAPAGVDDGLVTTSARSGTPSTGRERAPRPVLRTASRTTTTDVLPAVVTPGGSGPGAVPATGGPSDAAPQEVGAQEVGAQEVGAQGMALLGLAPPVTAPPVTALSGASPSSPPGAPAVAPVPPPPPPTDDPVAAATTVSAPAPSDPRLSAAGPGGSGPAGEPVPVTVPAVGVAPPATAPAAPSTLTAPSEVGLADPVPDTDPVLLTVTAWRLTVESGAGGPTPSGATGGGWTLDAAPGDDGTDLLVPTDLAPA